MLHGPWMTAEGISREAPEFATAVEEVAGRVKVAAAAAYGELDETLGSTGVTIVNQAINDLVDLCFDTLTGRGRSAMRTSRALFEHNVNAHEVASSPDARRRYADHEFVVHQMRAGLSREADFLQGKDRKSFEFELHKLKRTSEHRAHDAIDAHGAGFQRSWADKSLFDLAMAHGLSDGYNFYRLASAILHGSAGGSIGTTKYLDDHDQRIVRTGPALALCPTAFLYGVENFEGLLDAFHLVGDARLDELRAAIKRAKGTWPCFWKAIGILDASLWPEGMPPGIMAVFAVGPHGTARWYLHDVENGLVRAALPPEEPLDPDLARRLESAREQLRFVDAPEGKLHSIAALGVTLRPEPDSKWMPELALLHQRPFGVHPSTPPWQWDLPQEHRWDITKGGAPPDPPEVGHDDPFP